MEKEIYSKLAPRFEAFRLYEDTTHTVTYMARDITADKIYLIKSPRTASIDSQDIINHYKEINDIVSEIDHPNIEHIDEIQNHDGNIFAISLHQEKISLADQIQAGLTLKDALNIMIQAAHGLSAAHNSKIIHGSLDPNSISTLQNGETVVSNFGAYVLAKGVPPQIQNIQKLQYANYLAPELSDGREPTIASDIYSLGATIYETVTGRAPFSGDNAQTVFVQQREKGILLPTVLNKNLPDDIENLLIKTLQLEPENRYHTSAEMASDVTRVRNIIGPEVLIRRVPPNKPPPTSYKTHQNPPKKDPMTELSTDLSDDRSDWIECPACHTIMAAESTKCEKCWHPLSKETLVTTTQAERIQRIYNQKVIIRKILRYVLPITAAIAAIYFVSRPEPPPGLNLDPPTTDITAISQPGEWVSFGHDTAGTSYVTTDDSKLTGTLKWVAEIGEPISGGAVSYKKKLFVVAADKFLVSLDQETGKTLWRTELPTPSSATPLVANDLIFIGTAGSSVLAFDTQNGEVVWDVPLGEGILRSGVLSNGVLYVAGINGFLFALDANSGEVRWKREMGSGIRGTPAIHEGKLLVATTDRHLFVLDEVTGEITLDYLLPRGAEQSPVIDPQRSIVYIGSNYRTFHAININATNILLEKGINRWWAQLYIWEVVPRGPIQSGAIWNQRLPSKVTTDAAIGGGKVFVGTEQGALYALNDQDGSVIWMFQTDERLNAPITAVNQTIFAGSNDDTLYAVDAQTGTEIWRINTEGNVQGAPSYSNGVLFVTSRDGKVYAIR